MSPLLQLSTVGALIGAGLTAGVFYAFSSFVMRALGRLPAEQGIAAMQSINVAVLNPWFFAPFFGTAVLCLIVAALVLTGAGDGRAVPLLVACALYVVGCLLVTGALNVPLNDRLAAVEPAAGAALWAEYLAKWTFWNHVRTAASLAAAVLFTFAATK